MATETITITLAPGRETSVRVTLTNNGVKIQRGEDFAVADLSLADFGRKEITLAEHEMPGLMATRAKYNSRPLEGVRIMGSLHMTIQTAVLIETLQALGANVRWCSCNIYSTQDHAAAGVAANGTSVFAWKGESLEDYWDCTYRALIWPSGEGPQLIVDDGGDATLLIHRGFAGTWPQPQPRPRPRSSSSWSLICHTNRTRGCLVVVVVRGRGGGFVRAGVIFLILIGGVVLVLVVLASTTFLPFFPLCSTDDSREGPQHPRQR